jgi:mycothiol system anti-sigma-R factor
MPSIDCKKWFDKLYRILDCDKDDTVWKDVEKHMKDCRPCWDRLEFEKRLKEKIKSSCCKESCTESLRTRIKALFEKY